MTLSVCESAILCEILTELRCITPIDSTGGSGDYMSGIDGPDLTLRCVTWLGRSHIAPSKQLVVRITPQGQSSYTTYAPKAPRVWEPLGQGVSFASTMEGSRSRL